MKLSSIGSINHIVDQYTKEMNVSQAAQFDGPMNSEIEKHAIAAIGFDYAYEEYVMYAQSYSTATVLSQAEYQAMDRAVLQAAIADAIDNSGLAKELDKSFAQALITSIGVMSVSVDENDKILVEHWDANMLFNHRNHTE